MFRFTDAQFQEAAPATLFARLHGFLRATACSMALREALDDRDDVVSFWRPLWHHVQAMSEHDAWLYLTYVWVACRLEGLELRVAHEATAVREGDVTSPDSQLPEQRLKLFLSERGHLRFSVFDFPEAGTAEDAEPLVARKGDASGGVSKP